MKRLSKECRLLCVIFCVTAGASIMMGETNEKENAARAKLDSSINCVIFTIHTTSHEVNEIRKNVDKDFFTGLQKQFEKSKIEKANIILKSPCFQNRNFYLIVRVGKDGANDPIVGKICSSIGIYEINHAISLKSIEYLTE